MIIMEGQPMRSETKLWHEIKLLDELITELVKRRADLYGKVKQVQQHAKAQLVPKSV
jgi:hypothetical protein